MQPEEQVQIEIREEDARQFRRLDQFLSEQTQLSRTTIKRLFETEEIVGTVPLKLNRMPPIAAKILINIPPPAPGDLLPEKIPLDILHEDDDIILINKSAGMVVHPAPGNRTGTLLNALLHHCPDLAKMGGGQRPGIVHRLDKGTSGVMVAAKTEQGHEKLIDLFTLHAIERVYVGMAQLGRPLPPIGKVDGLIARHPKNRLKMSSRVSQGKRAITHYRVIKQCSTFQLLELKLETGRTHQIRVHLSEQLKTPILCDHLYGNPKQQLKNLEPSVQKLLAKYEYPLLHARKLGFVHPVTKEYLEFQAPIPSPFKDLLKMGQITSI